MIICSPNGRTVQWTDHEIGQNKMSHLARFLPKSGEMYVVGDKVIFELNRKRYVAERKAVLNDERAPIHDLADVFAGLKKLEKVARENAKLRKLVKQLVQANAEKAWGAPRFELNLHEAMASRMIYD